MAEPREDPAQITDPPNEQTDKPRRKWRVARFVVAGVLALLALVAVGLAVLFWRLGEGPLSLPQALQDRIEAQIDGSMSASSVTLSDISLAMVDGSRRPRFRLSDVELRDEAGVRAVFPELSVTFDGAALLRRQLRPIQVVIDGAALTVSRDTQGQFDLALANSDDATSLDLEESLARIDAMFASPVFERLENVEGRDLSIALQDDITGQVIRASNGSLGLDRKGPVLTLRVRGDIAGTLDASLAFAVTRNPVTQATDMRLQFDDMSSRDLATTTPALAWLDLLRAPISGAMITRLSDDGTVGDLSGSLRVGEGELTPNDTIAPLPFDALDVYFDFDADAGRLSFTEFALASPALSVTATGHADLVEAENSFIGQFQLAEITTNPLGLYDSPLQLDGGAADIRLSLSPNMRLEIGQAVLFKDDLRVQASGVIEALQDGFAIALDASLPETNPQEVLAFWPRVALERSRIWVEENVLDGVISNVEFALRHAPDADPIEVLRFDFAQATSGLARGFPPMEGGAGYLSMVGPRLVIQIDEGAMPSPNGGAVSLAGSHIVVENSRRPGPDGVVQLEIASPLPDLLSLLSLPPTNLLRNAPQFDPATLIDGQVVASGSLGLRLMPDQTLADMDLDIQGRGFDLRSTQLVQGRVLTARELAISVTSERVEVSGDAALDGVPITGAWAVPMVEAGQTADSRVEGRARLSGADLSALGVDLPPDLVSGEGVAQFEMDIPAGGLAPRLALSSDLDGVGLSIPGLGWSSARGSTGELALEMVLGPEPEVRELTLDISGLRLDASVDLGQGGVFERLDAERFSIGNWIDVQGALVSRGDGVAPAINVSSGRMDLRGLQGARRGSGGESGPITQALDRLEVSRGIALTELRAQLTQSGGLSGEFQANVNGAVPISGSLSQTPNGSAITINADNGGAVLRAAGIIQTAYGGAMELTLLPTGQAGSFDGELSIDSPRLRDAPVMAELLNLISVVGLLEQLGGQGINLGQVQGRFRLTPSAIQILEGSAIGPSMGISMDGVYDIEARQIDMQGVVSPFYGINGLFGALLAPRREGLFGFSYRLTGPTDATSVSVNPFSILTPGIFREIFRRPPPEIPE